jgi:hypothetical protein
VKAKALLLLAPAVLLVLLASFYRQEAGTGRDAGRTTRETSVRGQRLIIVIVDSLRQATLEKPGVMPHLLALARDGATRRFPLLTCSANFTLPCLQTLMEGRQSPFVSGLHNFTGMQGGAGSIARSLQDAGVRLAIVGDHALLDLYGRHAAATWGVESLEGNPLRRDMAAVSKAVELLDAQSAFDVLLLHVPGTDKAAHHKQPGTAAYDDHHRQVDEALLAVWQRVDTASDDLLVMGDHGHDDQGDHSRQSLVLLRGPRFAELLAGLERLPDGIAQEELLYFMSYPFALPLPPSYEGRFFLSRAAAGREDGSALPGSLRRFEETQRRTLIAEKGTERTLAEGLAQREARRREEPRELLLRLLPLLSLTLLWALLFFEGRLGPGRRALAATLLFGGLAAGLYYFATPANGPPLATMGLVASVWGAWRYHAWRSLVFLWVVTAGAGLIGYFARDWAELMHTRGSFNIQAILFHLLFPLAGAGLALLRFGRVARFPEGMGLIGLLLLPSGVYYYQAGRNLLLGYAMGEALLLAGRGALALNRGRKAGLHGSHGHWRSLFVPRRVAAIVAFTFAVTVILFQEAGGWEWGLRWVNWLNSCPGWVPALFFWAAGGYLASQAPTAPGQGMLLAVLGLTRIYSVGIAGLDLASLAASLVAVLLLSAILELDPAALTAGDRTGSGDCSNEDRKAGVGVRATRDALLLTAVVVWMLWVLLRGFFINHVGYHFAFDLLGEFTQESHLALAFGLATLLKYGLPLFFALLVYHLRRRGAAGMHAFSGLLFLLQLKLLLLLIQALLVPLRTAEKLNELALADLAFILGILLVVVLATLLLWLGDKLATMPVTGPNRVLLPTAQRCPASSPGVTAWHRRGLDRLSPPPTARRGGR